MFFLNSIISFFYLIPVSSVKLSKQLLQIKDGFALIQFILLPRPKNCHGLQAVAI